MRKSSRGVRFSPHSVRNYDQEGDGKAIAIGLRLCWSTYMTRMREVIAGLIGQLRREVVHVRDSKENHQNRGIEELAQSVLDYGRMRLRLYPQQAVVVEVDELAFRLRETRRTIKKVLYLLESQRQAKRTELEGLWTLQI